MMKKKNFLFLMVDQLRADYLSCYGNTAIKTPNIDKLTESGVLFKRAVCNSPLCAPSRASLACGVFPHRLGVLDNLTNCPKYLQTHYKILRDNGYGVYQVGKSDLHKPIHDYGEGGFSQCMEELGFTDCVETSGKMAAALYDPKDANVKWGDYGPYNFFEDENKEEYISCPYQQYLHDKGLLTQFSLDYKKRMTKDPVWQSKLSAIKKENYHDVFIGDTAIEMLDEFATKGPWYHFVSFVGPHDPYDAPEEYYNLVKDGEVPDNIDGTDENLADKTKWIIDKARKQNAGSTKDAIQETKRNYQAMILMLDDYIGRIIDKLKELNQYEDTVIIFTADHGEMMGDFGLYRKSVMYNSAVKVPLVISHPSFVQGIKSDALVSLVDLFPTILDLAGVDYDDEYLDGKSLCKVLTGQRTTHAEYQVSELSNTRMICDGKYKFIENHNDKNELYDLENDPFELRSIDDKKMHSALKTKMYEVRR